MPAARVLLVANRTAMDEPLLQAVRGRAARGPASFHLLVPATPRGLHRVVDPEDAGREDARVRLAEALPILSQAAGSRVTGRIGDANPLAAISDAHHLQGFDEIILSTSALALIPLAQARSAQQGPRARRPRAARDQRPGGSTRPGLRRGRLTA